MHFSRLAPALAGLVGAAQAHSGGFGNALKPATFDCGKSWDNDVLFDGNVNAATEVDAAVYFGLNLREAQVEGDICIEASADFATEPSIRLSLAGVKAYFELDVSASAAVYQTVELVASPEVSVDAGLLELDLAAAFALDLIVGVNAAVDLSAGFYVSFQDGDYIDISLLTKEVIDSNLDGLLTKALPIGVGASVDLSAEIEVQLGLRLRSHIVVDAGVELLGLDVLDAGAEIAIWADLLSHTITLVQTADCVVSVTNDFFLSLGVAIDVSASVLDILDIGLAPEVTVTLAKTLGLEVCLPNLGNIGDFLLPIPPAVEPVESTQGSAEPVAPASVSGSVAASASGTVSASEPGTPAATVSGTPVASPAVSAPASLSSGAPITTGEGLVTSTVKVTKTYTITSCAASVPNCPATATQKIVTSTIIDTVVVCPATQTGIPTTTTKPKKPVVTLTETLTTVVPCKPTTSTYTPPKDFTKPVEPTVTVCPPTTAHPSKTPEHGIPASTGAPSASGPAPTGPANTPGVPEVPTAPQPTAVNPPQVPGNGQPVTWTHPATNNTMVTLQPSTVAVPSASVTPGQPPASGAGSIKVGVALAMPALIALLV